MPLFLTAHTTYSSVQLGISDGEKILIEAHEETKLASKNFILLVQTVLQQAGVTVEALDFIVAYSGPAPFTTLRVSLASVNGLAFARQIPLVGVNGLECFANEQKDRSFSQTLALLNAFGNDLYVGIYDTSSQRVISTSCMSLTSLTEYIMHYNKPIKCVGNGATLHKQHLLGLNGLVTIPEDNPPTCSLASVARNGLQQWETTTSYSRQLMPLYLKNHPATQL